MASRSCTNFIGVIHIGLQGSPHSKVYCIEYTFPGAVFLVSFGLDTLTINQVHNYLVCAYDRRISLWLTCSYPLNMHSILFPSLFETPL